MEGELLCTPAGDALIIADKMQQQDQRQEKVDGNVAQKIQEECDKQFSDSHVSNGHAEVGDALTNGNADVGEDVKENGVELQQNGNHTNEEPEKHEEEQIENKEKSETVEEKHEEPEIAEQKEENQKVLAIEEEVPMDSLNATEESTITTSETIQEVPKVEIVETIEKVEKIEETKPETPEPVEEPKPETPEIIESPQKVAPEIPNEPVEEEKLQNGHTTEHTECDNVEMEQKTEKIDLVDIAQKESPVSGDDEPIKGYYQPEQIENFGISVRDMVNDMPRIIEDDMKAPKESVPNAPRKGAIATSMDTESVRDAYNDIRADNSETMWAVFKYEASRIVCAAKGVAFDEFKKLFDDGERAYGYIRLQTGDEMSKRYKFLFVTWIGPGVSVLKRAKMSIDKAIIKNVISNFAVELQLETQSEFDLPFFIESLNKASGANYGTGVRDI